MTADLLFRICLAHVVGDYLLQTDWMALNKKEKGWFGWKAAFVHCWIWTACIFVAILPEFIAVIQPYCVESAAAITGSAALIALITPIGVGIGILALIFVSHWVLDRYNFVEWWLHLIGSKSYRCFNETYALAGSTIEDYWPHNVFSAAYTALVQTVADNGLHLLFLYLIMKYMVL